MEAWTSWSQLIADQICRHGAMEVRDLYKLLYQGVLGPEHLVASAESFAAYLREEYEPLLPDEEELPWEAIRPDGRLGRVNLRPFKARGGDLSWLVTACLETARQAWGTPEELRAVWAALVEQCRADPWERFPPDEVLAFTAWLEERGYPAVHHSAGYEEANRPAYRLLASEFLENDPPAG